MEKSIWPKWEVGSGIECVRETNWIRNDVNGFMDEIVNRVAASSLVVFDLEQYYQQGARKIIDISQQLEGGVLLREKEFRNFIKTNDWAEYSGAFVAIHCSADAIVPAWAYMLLSLALQPFARRVVRGSIEDLERQLFMDELARVDWKQYDGQRVVVKGCSKFPVPESAYVEAVFRLRPWAASIMYGEPCSTVPLFKKVREH